MWFNILPAASIVYAGMAMGGYGLWWAHYYVIGNHFRRTLNHRWDRQLYQRDMRLNGNPYNVIGLEAIPDAPAKN